jgi:hypothetical protein
MTLDIATIHQFAPIVKIHPNEKHYPMDPAVFIARSRFRHQRGGTKDQGYNKKTRKWVTSSSRSDAYYDVPVSLIRRFGLWKNGENRRPRDSNNGNHWNVFLQPNGKPKGRKNPNGVVPAFYATRFVDTSKIPKKLRKQFGIRIEKYHKIQYWWFNGYNDGPLSGGGDNHQGDWEHITIQIKNGAPKAIYFAAHGEPMRVALSKVRWKGNRPIVYSAVGSHASYPRPGKWSLFGPAIKDETKEGGRVWETVHSLASVRSQPWRDFAGAWGEVGEFAHTTGPLGPWHKRRKN